MNGLDRLLTSIESQVTLLRCAIILTIFIHTKGGQMDEDRKDFEIRLAEIRGDLTYKEFGETLGFSRDSARNFERGKYNPSPLFLAALREKYGVDLNYLMTGESLEDRAQMIVTEIYQATQNEPIETFPPPANPGVTDED